MSDLQRSTLITYFSKLNLIKKKIMLSSLLTVVSDSLETHSDLWHEVKSYKYIPQVKRKVQLFVIHEQHIISAPLPASYAGTCDNGGLFVYTCIVKLHEYSWYNSCSQTLATELIVNTSVVKKRTWRFVHRKMFIHHGRFNR